METNIPTTCTIWDRARSLALVVSSLPRTLILWKHFHIFCVPVITCRTFLTFKSPRRPLQTLEHFSHPHFCWPLSICSHCDFTTEQTLVWITYFIYKTESSTTYAYCHCKSLIHTLTANNSYTHHDYCVCNRNYICLHHERPQGFRLCWLGTYVTPVQLSAMQFINHPLQSCSNLFF